MAVICEYQAAYHARVVGMILKIQREEYNIPVTIDDQPDLKDIENFYQKDGAFWVALHGDQVIGTVAVINIGNGNAVMRKMFVEKEFRGKDHGISAQLLLTLLDWTKQNRFSACWLGTTPQFLAAHKFYEKNGFREISRNELPVGFPVMTVDKKFYMYSLG
jgi:GNAT superfamily N-acetyltransferase